MNFLKNVTLGAKTSIERVTSSATGVLHSILINMLERRIGINHFLPIVLIVRVF